MPALKNVSIEATARAWIEVDLSALRRNLRVISECLAGESRLLPMVKANAYGLGMERVVRALTPSRPWGFGVATTEEGRELRRMGWDGRVVVFAPLLPADVPDLLHERLEPAVSGIEALLACAEAAGDAVLSVHLEVDTGMGRLGLGWWDADLWAPDVSRAISTGSIRLSSTLTHFHSAESDREATRLQWERLRSALASMREVGLDPGLIHAANSAAAMLDRDLDADLARPGIYMYGGGDWEPRAAPVVAVRARVLAVRDVPAGTSVSYGATWTAPGPTRLATLAIGYGDGLRRGLSNRGRALIHGEEAPIRGAVCMDTIVVDIGERTDVRRGDVATLLGADGGVNIGLQELADLCDTIDYEILTGWTDRLPRVEIERSETELGAGLSSEALTTIRDGI
jgi:alanine racemase